MTHNTIPPISAAAHYAKSAGFWENEAKRLQGIVDAQDAIITEQGSTITDLREHLATYEPPEPSEAQQTEPDPAAA